jgi:hypothetical protein
MYRFFFHFSGHGGRVSIIQLIEHIIDLFMDLLQHR